jgi:hypothetical protein
MDYGDEDEILSRKLSGKLGVIIHFSTISQNSNVHLFEIKISQKTDSKLQLSACD